VLLKVVCALQLGQQPLGSASLAIEAGGAGALQHSSTAVARPSTGAGRPAAGVDPRGKPPASAAKYFNLHVFQFRHKGKIEIHVNWGKRDVLGNCWSIFFFQ